jgi:hypothetical protein
MQLTPHPRHHRDSPTIFIVGVIVVVLILWTLWRLFAA